MEDCVPLLEQLGLTRNESLSYVTLLRTGTTRTGELLKSSGLNSGKIYEILENLKRKGLVSETVKSGTRHFTAAPPEQILHFLALKKDALSQQERVARRIIPQLGMLKGESLQEKRIVTYSGLRGIMTASEEALGHLSPGDEILSLGISDVNAWTQEYWVKWERLRERKHIRARYLLSQKGKAYRDIAKAKLVEMRMLERNTPAGIDIYGKRHVLLLHYRDPTSCTLIEDEDTATTFRSYFEELWTIAKRVR